MTSKNKINKLKLLFFLVTRFISKVVRLSNTSKLEVRLTIGKALHIHRYRTESKLKLGNIGLKRRLQKIQRIYR